MDESFEDNDRSVGTKPKNKIRGLWDFLLIIRDRWLLSLTLAIPIALGFVYKELQVPEYYRSAATFRLIPPQRFLIYRKLRETIK